jgi:hypothetical protein
MMIRWYWVKPAHPGVNPTAFRRKSHGHVVEMVVKRTFAPTKTPPDLIGLIHKSPAFIKEGTIMSRQTGQRGRTAED